MGEKTNLTIQSEMFQALVVKADSVLKMKVLMLPLLLEFDEAGWTVKSYSKRGLLAACGLAWGGKNARQMGDYLAELKAAGVLLTKPEDGFEQHYKFSYASTPVVYQDGVQSTPVVYQDGVQSTPVVYQDGVQSTPVVYQQSEDSTPTNVIIASAPESESKESESKESEKTLTESERLLASVGVGANNYHLAKDWELGELQARVESVRQRADIKNKPGYVVACLKSSTPLTGAMDEVRKAYEQKIGGVTPLILEGIKTALQKYPLGWVTDAIGEATNWGAVEQKLKVWNSNGRTPPTPQKNLLGTPQSTEISAELRELAKNAYPTWIYPNGKPAN